MKNTLKRVTGVATIAGATVLTVPVNTTVTVIGLRASNGSTSEKKIHFKVGGTLVSGANTPLPAASAIDVMAGSKIVAMAGDTIKAFADADTGVEIYVSYLEQLED